MAGDTCARCGDRARKTVRARPEWQHFLCEERGVPRPIHQLAFPLCGDCAGKLDYMHEMSEDPMVSDTKRQSFEENIRDFLSELDTELLQDKL